MDIRMIFKQTIKLVTLNTILEYNNKTGITKENVRQLKTKYIKLR